MDGNDGKAAVKAGGNVIYSVGSWRLSDDGSVHRRGRLKYPNGDVYDGEWIDGKRHGRGLLTFGAGGSYTGEFAHNLFEGFGVLRIPKSQHPLTKLWMRGEKYEGEFLRGLKHGRGTWQTRGGDQYDGELKHGLYDGRGVCVYGSSGDVYDGEFVRGLHHGHGELRFRNGSVYNGGFRLGNFHGFGRMLYGSAGVNGSYVGDFVDGKRHGQGVRIYGSKEANNQSRRRYEGAWQDDEPHGAGVLERDGSTAVGRFENGYQTGPGVMKYANGDTYDGNFQRGELHGEGRVVYRDGGVYEGTFVRSQRHGKGMRVFSNGDRYEGDWENNLMHGRGTHTSTTIIKPKGKNQRNGGRGVLVYEGEYCDGHQTGEASISYTFTPTMSKEGDRPETEVKDHKLTWEWSSEFEYPEGSGCWHCGRGKTTYRGGVLRGRFHGHGVLRSPDGKLWSGEWTHGQLHGPGERVYLPVELDALLVKEILSTDARDVALGIYRVVRYVGEFAQGVQHGKGELLYTNGYRVHGQFVNGHVQGVAVCGFGGKQHQGIQWRHAEFERGERKRWLSDEEETFLREQKQVEQDTEMRRRSVLQAFVK
ncbi:Vacuolar protein sorting-associated protein 8 [Phytophthora boehmeriae]|uniref:Vacuolar protein sorting-associated protein 8 n=1 Tax=Phytophthora boehmeriae TaxID=109152 RepID=A0A8T1WTU6_9STRA|nr:Vacuolar protein sorting-associated protein 8 [Phytophthora boehmeriae]